jgi:4-alpha-glucanotransferase
MRMRPSGTTHGDGRLCENADASHCGRRAGILLAVSSLSETGTLGKEAYAFVDFLADAGQSFWQILPIGPVGKTLSPYQSRSAFAGNPDFIEQTELGQARQQAPKFPEENAAWLDGYALFEAVRKSQKNKPLHDWPDEFRNPSAKTLKALRKKYEDEIAAVLMEQHCFFRQWYELKRYANHKGIGIIGDLPIYIYEDSADFWLRRSLFDVDKDGRPASSAGVPPDAFSKSGQLWNNPVYDWAGHSKGVFTFWRERLAQAARMYDGVRIDHFRAFADYYAITVQSPATLSFQTERNNPVDLKLSGLLRSAHNDDIEGRNYEGKADNGEWRIGPGLAFTDMIKKEFPGLLVIAEDLGELSGRAKQLVKDCGFPGMSVLQFAFSGDPKNPYLPHNIPENAVCYTGTHDNDTAVGWLGSLPKKKLRYAMEYLGLSNQEDLPGAMIAAALASKADTAIIPLQDWLGLGTEARLNKPSTTGGRNWKWKIPKGALTKRLATRIRFAAKSLYGR